jgi:uncharacterized membrane protein
MTRIFEKISHILFRFTVVTKAINGAIQVTGGAVLLAVRPEVIDGLLRHLVRYELADDPKDILVNSIAHWTRGMSRGTEKFVAIYILTHGAVNLILSIGLWREKLWAFPAALTITCSFLIYQIYRVAVHHSLVLAAFTVWDICIIILICHEYSHLRQKNR